MSEHVLAVAGAELQLAQQVDQTRMDAVDVGVERGPLALFDDPLLDFLRGLLERLLAAGRVDATVGDQAFQGEAGNLAAHPVEAREAHRRRRVVDDDVDPGQLLEHVDVAPLATDDPALHLVVWQAARAGSSSAPRAGRRGAASRSARMRRARLLGLTPGLLLDPAQGKAGLAASVHLDFVEKHLACLVCAQRGDPFQFGTLQLTELSVQRLQPIQNQSLAPNRCRVTNSTAAC